MPRLSVCIEMFWQESDPVERVGHAADAGFGAVEFWAHSNKDVDALANAARARSVTIAACCMEAGGALVDPDAGPALAAGLEVSCTTANHLGVGRLIATTGNTPEQATFGETRAAVIHNLRTMTPVLDGHGVDLVLEPLNTLVDHPGYWLTAMSDAAGIIEEVGHPRIKILMDIYHQQITEGNIINNIRRYAPLIGHYHCAGVPGRGELAGGELDYRAVFEAIDASGYAGFVGLEFRAAGPPEAALAQAQALAQS